MGEFNMNGRFEDITQQKFGRLLALETIRQDNRGEFIWKCLCDCGNYKEIRSSALRYGTTKSCGCFNSDSLSNRRRKVNDNYFETPNIENSYWAGFIAADGNIFQLPNPKWQKKLNIGLSVVDLEHLEKFCLDIGYFGKIHSFTNNKGRGIVSIQITSDKICDDLQRNFGIVQRKSLILEPPSFLTNMDMVRAFIKGYIDGDGSIGIYGWGLRISLIGTEAFLTWVMKMLEEQNDIVLTSVKKNKEKQLYYFYVSGKKAEIVIRDLMGVETPFLKRKWDKALA